MIFTFAITIFIASIIIALYFSTGKGERLGRRLDDIGDYWHPKKRVESKRQLFLDKKGIRVAKEGTNLVIDVSTPTSHKHFFIPDITKEDVDELIEALTKLDSALEAEKK